MTGSEQALQRSGGSSKRWRGTILALAAGLMLALLACVWMSRERGLSVWMETMRAKGERFTIEELADPAGPSDDKSLVVIMNAAPKFSLQVARRKAALTNAAPKVPPGHRPVAWAQENFTTLDGWTMTWHDAQTELGAVQNEFRQIHHAVQRPRLRPGLSYYASLGTVPSDGFFSFQLMQSFQARRIAAQWLANGTIFELHRDRAGPAHEHLLALIRLVRLHEDGWVFQNQSLRMGTLSLGLGMIWEALQARGWTEEDWASLQGHLSRCQVLTPMIKTLEVERALAVRYFASMRDPKATITFGAATSRNKLVRLFEQAVISPLYRTAWHEGDEWFYLRQSQAAIEALRDVSTNRSWLAATAALRHQDEPLTDRFQGLSRYRYAISAQLLGSLWPMVANAIKLETQQQMAVTAMALKRFQIRFGRFPSDLQTLIPEFLSEPPADYWAGRPLQYRLNLDGSFLLYASGPDMRDQNGDPELDFVWEQAWTENATPD